MSEIEIPNIFRYKFSDSFIQILHEFSKIHQYDDRAAFKEAWTQWIADNDAEIKTETKRLIDLGYGGNVEGKMFKSSRYYFRNKSTEKREPAKRRQYIGMSPFLLAIMDEHISKTLNTKPADSFVEFCRLQASVLDEEVQYLLKKGIQDKDEINSKIKKTYKNRYFIAIKPN
jgi:hypothetical protein